MVRKRSQPEPAGQPEIDPARGIKLLEGQIEKAQTLLKTRPLNPDDCSQWELVTKNYLEKAFGKNSPNVNSVTDVGKFGFFSMDESEYERDQRRAEDLQTQVSRLQGLVELLQTDLELQSSGRIDTPVASPQGHRIFLVHGHDDAALHEVARFLEQLQQEVVVLREQPSQGRTIIEKFEDYGDVAFAVVLLTADDRGGSIKASVDAQKPRARQNVILELGYFLGRLGRSRVCALYRDGVEVPSDYSGVLYVMLDANGGWRLQLAKELKASSLPVDMNRAL